MEYVDDQDDANLDVSALMKIKDWADEQMLKMRRPGKQSLDTAQDPPRAGDPLNEPAPDDGQNGQELRASPPGSQAPDDNHSSETASDEPGSAMDQEPDEDDNALSVLSIMRPGDRAPKAPVEADPFEKDPLKKLGSKMPVPRRR